MDAHIRVGTKALILRDDAILLVEYNDESGIHYNMPGGGIEPDETLEEVLIREVKEETCAEIEVGRPLIITEYEPKRNSFWGGPLHKLTVIFECSLKGGKEPRMPQTPDPIRQRSSGSPWLISKTWNCFHTLQIKFWPTRTNRQLSTQSIYANP